MTRVLRLLGYVWALLNTLIGALLVIYYGARVVSWSEGALEVVIKRPSLIGGPWVGAQTFGWLIFYRDEKAQSDRSLRVHERVHVRDALILGPLFLVAYAACFLYQWVRRG